MSDFQAEPRATHPFPSEDASAPAPADPLAGDWSEGLPGPIRAHGLPLPTRVGNGPRPVPAAEPAMAAAEPSIEAPDAWTADPDPLPGFSAGTLQPAETPWSEPVQDTGTAAPWMAPPGDPDFAAAAQSPAEAGSAGARPEGWQDPEPSPWAAAPQPTAEWSETNQPAASGDGWESAPADASAATWESPETGPARAPAPISSAMPEESTWTAPPPGEGGELMPEPAVPGWMNEKREVFTPLPQGASLSEEYEELPRTVGDDEAQMLLRPVEDLDPALQPVMDPTLQPMADGEAVRMLDAHDHPDLPARLDEDAPPMAAGAAPPVGTLVSGEHRVAIHTRAGRTRRGSVTDLDLGRPQFALQPQGGGSTEIISHREVKAIFFMLAPGEKADAAAGRKVRVTFADGRSIEGHHAGAEGPKGFFLVPLDAQRTNTRRIYVLKEAVAALTNL